MLGSAPTSQDAYPISQTLNTQNPGPVAWPTAHQGRPTLTGGAAAGRIAGVLSDLDHFLCGVAIYNTMF